MTAMPLPYDPPALYDRPGHRTPIDQYVAALHETVRQLVAVDVRSGGDEAAKHAVRALAAARLRLATEHRGRSGADLTAATAELAELTGWLLIDANRHRAAHRANRLALRLARDSGDRSMELFVIHNMSLHATYLRRPAPALDLVRPVLERGHLTARLDAMFRLRAARAHAQMGLGSEAFRLLGQARSRLLDGVDERDPAWSWWVSPRGFDFATGAMHGTLDDWRSAIPSLHRALAATPPAATRDRFLYLCALLHAEIEVNAWRDAESTAAGLVPLIGAVGSGRPLSRLAATIESVGTSRGPSALRLRRVVEAVREALVRPAGTGSGTVRPTWRRSGVAGPPMGASVR